ncbi:Phospholipid:diacylglycerol acyltransferase, partial [Ceratocystis fimbriata CBS 114723]
MFCQLWKHNTFTLLVGCLVGIVTAGVFARNSELIDPKSFGDLSIESLYEAIQSDLPASLASDIRDLLNGEKQVVDSSESFAIGLKMASEGYKAHHPLVMIPGVISTGLESWGTSNSSRAYFRKRLWGSWTMMRALVLDKDVWKKHIMLDTKTGLDPPDIKIRAAQGFDAADFFITGYWLWSKIIENLASIGYDPTNSHTAAYDWRLSYANLEVRDRYFSHLKAHIETSVNTQGKKATLISHSMGSQVLFYFFHWVASEQGGKGGDGWVEKYVDSWVNVSGCMLGAIKGAPAVLSGEMRDTAQLNAIAGYGLEKFLSKGDRADIFRAMPGVSSMFPIGGTAIWGDLESAPDDLPGQGFTFGSVLNFRDNVNPSGEPKNFTIDDTMDYLYSTTEEWYRNMAKNSYSKGVAYSADEVNANENDPSKWINPLETRLPLAPSLKIYCFYGVGKATERAYYYKKSNSILNSQPNITIDTSVTENHIDHGVIMGEGDGTVNLLSTGYMCNKGWKMPRYNPAGAKVTVVELPHNPETFNLRGGSTTADHVDILGSQPLNKLLLRVAAGKGDEIQES